MSFHWFYSKAKRLEICLSSCTVEVKFGLKLTAPSNVSPKLSKFGIKHSPKLTEVINCKLSLNSTPTTLLFDLHLVIKLNLIYNPV